METVLVADDPDMEYKLIEFAGNPNGKAILYLCVTPDGRLWCYDDDGWHQAKLA